MICEFPIYEQHPAVIYLAVHLKNGQRVYINGNNIREHTLNPLISYFELCTQDKFTKNLLYYETRILGLMEDLVGEKNVMISQDR